MKYILLFYSLNIERNKDINVILIRKVKIFKGIRVILWIWKEN